MATHSSVLAWRIPGTGEPGGCCLWGHTESDTTEATASDNSWGFPGGSGVKNPPAQQKRCAHDAQREDHKKTQGEDDHLQARDLRKNQPLSTP